MTDERTPDTAASPPSLGDLNVHEAQQLVAEAPLGSMAELERQERAGGNRAGVLRAIEQRRREIAGGDQPTHTLRELSALARSRFGTVPSVVRAALRGAGVSATTLEQADAIIQEFKTQPAPHRKEEIQ